MKTRKTNNGFTEEITMNKSRLIGALCATVFTFITVSANAALVSDSALETFLGLAQGTLDGLGTPDPNNGGFPQDVTAGSAIKQDISGSAGGMLSFSWNFLSDEFDAGDGVFDLAFYSIDGVAYFLEDAEPAVLPAPPPFSASSTFFFDETGFSVETTVALSPGDHTIGFGVAHTQDEAVQAGLLIDSIFLDGVLNAGFESGDFSGWDTIGLTSIETAAFGAGPDSGTFQAFLHADDSFAVVPIPPALWLFGSGLFGLVGMARRKKTT